MRLLVWLPAYNEEESVGYMIDQLEKLSLDFVISNGFSTDRTAEIAQSRGVKVLDRSGFGKGDSIRDGLDYAAENNYDGLVLIDCDKTYPVDQIPRLAEEFKQADMVVGNRNMKDITFLRRISNILMTAILNMLYGSKIGDMASGMRILRVDKFHGRITTKSFDVEGQIYCIALGLKYKISQVDISYHARGGNSKINVSHLFLLIYRMFKERITGQTP